MTPVLGESRLETGDAERKRLLLVADGPEGGA